jgi:hypothetical protein
MCSRDGDVSQQRYDEKLQWIADGERNILLNRYIER